METKRRGGLPQNILRELPGTLRGLHDLPRSLRERLWASEQRKATDGATETVTVGGMPLRELPLTALYGVEEGGFTPPRKDFDDGSLLALADSIRLHGLLQPLVVRPCDKGSDYTVVCGQRRLRAMEILGYKKAPCLICRLPAWETAVLALCDNLHRRSLDLFEQAEAEEALLSFATADELSAFLSLPPSAVEERRALRNLSEREKLLIRAAELPESAAVALGRTEDAALRMAVLEALCRTKLTHLGKGAVENLTASCRASAKLGGAGRRLLLKNLRLFYNSIERAVDSVKDAGMKAGYTVREEDDRQVIEIVLYKDS